MARKRTVLTSAVEAELTARTARGETAETIFTAIHGALSVPTIRRRQRELRGTKPKPIQAQPQTTPEPDEVPENVPPQDVDYWLAKLNRIADVAETQGNLLRKLQGDEPTALRIGAGYEQRLLMKVVDGVAILYRKIERC